MEPSKDKDQKVERALLVRAYEASCRIEYPTPIEVKFREALMIKLSLAFELRGLRKHYDFGAPPEKAK